MKKIQNKKVKIWKNVVVIVLWLLCLYGLVQGYAYWNYTQAHSQQEYETTMWESLPEEAIIKIGMHNHLVKVLDIGVLLVVIFYILDYFYDPENHWAAPFIKWIKKVSVKLEDDEEEAKNETKIN